MDDWDSIVIMFIVDDSFDTIYMISGIEKSMKLFMQLMMVNEIYNPIQSINVILFK